jgi:hypothetical protein
LTASKEALDLIRASGLPIVAQAAMAAIAEREGGDTIGRLYSGGVLRDPNDPHVTTDRRGRLWNGPHDIFPAWKGADLDGNRGGDFSTAAGFLQFTGTTWRRVIARTGKSHFTNDHFTNGWWLADNDFRRNSGGMDLLSTLTVGNSKTLPLIHTYLASTWPGGCNADFPKRFAENLAVLQAPAPVPSDQITIEIDAAALIKAFHIPSDRDIVFVIKGH